jgi:Uri superfamily endonuclease
LKGSYCLIFEVKSDLNVEVRNGRAFQLKRGIYVYCGSAFGSGGLRRRVLRHMKRNKKRHWHIDFLTTREETDFLGVWIFEGKRFECKLAKEVSAVGEAVLGFGSTDCKCDSHLFKVESLNFLEEALKSFNGKFLKPNEVEKYGV